MRQRKGETRALKTAKEKKEKTKAHMPWFFCFVLFSFMRGQNHHGDVRGEHARAQLGSVDVLGEVPIGFQVHPTRCPVGPHCRAGHGFLPPAAWSPPG